MTRKICVVTGTRADYGLLKWVIRNIAHDPDLTLQLVATGMHLSPEFGLTYREIEQDGFHIDRKVEMLTSSDTAVGTAKALGLGIIGFADVLADLQPDLLVVLGDRFEIFGVVSAALFAKIPVAHLHGGELTQGAYDDAMRHSITKMSHLHFVAASEYRDRVIQLGEQPERVYQVGGLGVDSIKKLILLGRTELETSLDFKFGEKNLLVTFHPTTMDAVSGSQQLQALLQSLEALPDTHLIFTLPNADTGSRALIAMIEKFVLEHENAHAYTSLGQLRYLSCVAQVDGVVGNSSSGLLEAPSLGVGTINIGDRQKGRLCAASVINCEPLAPSISAALQKLYSPGFKESLVNVQSPYGQGGASDKIVEILKYVPLDALLTKKFYNLAHCGIETKSD